MSKPVYRPPRWVWLAALAMWLGLGLAAWRLLGG